MELFKKLICLILLAIPFSISTSHGQTKVLPLGDSITQGQNDGGSNQYNSYRRALWLLFQAAGTNVDFVGSMNKNFSNANPPDNDFDWDHDGHWGWRADEILNGRPLEGSLSNWLGGYTPDIALIYLGTNDAIQNQTALSTQTDIEDIIDVLQGANNNMEIYLAKIAYGKDPVVNPRIDALNALIPTIATNKSTLNSPVTVVDINALIVPNNHIYDTYHPNTTGEQIIAQAWYDAINNGTLPVTLRSFSATAKERKVSLNWTTAQEINSKEFEIQSRIHGQTSFEKVGAVAAFGNSTSPRDYQFQTKELIPGNYAFRLKVIDIDGSFSFSKTEEVRINHSFIRAYSSSPQELTVDLLQTSEEQLTLSLYDLLGRKVIQSSLDNSINQQKIPIDLSPGIYQIQIRGTRGLLMAQRIWIN